VKTFLAGSVLLAMASPCLSQDLLDDPPPNPYPTGPALDEPPPTPFPTPLPPPAGSDSGASSSPNAPWTEDELSDLGNALDVSGIWRWYLAFPDLYVEMLWFAWMFELSIPLSVPLVERSREGEARDGSSGGDPDMDLMEFLLSEGDLSMCDEYAWSIIFPNLPKPPAPPVFKVVETIIYVVEVDSDGNVVVVPRVIRVGAWVR
jgi:hypothetical protein